MNVLNAIGNLSADAEVKQTTKGKQLLSFNFALNSGYGDNQVTTWLRCTLYGDRATTLAPMLLKGTKIGITGEIANRKWVDKDGAEKYSLECNVRDITLLGKPTGNEGAKNVKPDDAFEDDVPF